MTTQASGTDLHGRIWEALQERIRLARAATPGPWTRGENGSLLAADAPRGVVVCSVGMHGGMWPNQADAEFTVANGPDVEIRRAEAGLRTLDRHAPEVVTYPSKVTNTECQHCHATYPCIEVRELADGEGIQP